MSLTVARIQNEVAGRRAIDEHECMLSEAFVLLLLNIVTC